MVGAVSPPERCSWSERSPDAKLPGRCPKFYPAPPGVEPGRGRDRAGTGLAPATAPATATAPTPAVPAPAPAGGPGPCPRVSVLYEGAQPLAPRFGSRSRDPDSPSSNLGISPPGAFSPSGSRLCHRSRQDRGNLPSTDRGEGTDRTPLPPPCTPSPGSKSVHGQGTDGLSSPWEPSVKAAAAAARGDTVMSNTETL